VSRASGAVELAVVGLSHHTAPLEVREHFVCDAARSAKLSSELAAHGHALLLSTCNRTELYLATLAGDDAVAAARRVLAEQAEYEEAAASHYLYVRRDRDAVRHLLRVAAGLDSLVVGEAQIQGQVRAAHEQAARQAAQRDPMAAVLGRLFECALGVGGRVRAETKLGAGAASVPSAAVELARKIFGSLGGRRAAVVGSGEMSGLALRCLAAEGVEESVVLGRTPDRTERLAERAGAVAARLDELPALLATCDIILTATASPATVLHVEDVRPALAGRRGPLLLVDIALPRDVDAAVGELPGVFLYDLDDLRAVVESTLDRRRDEIAEAERIVDEGVADFWSWYRGRVAVPVIRELRGRAERVRRRELERAFRSLSHLPEDDREAVANLTRQLLAKLLHLPTERLREAAVAGRDDEIVAVARYLFALDDDARSGDTIPDRRRNGNQRDG
jgi:glutamyl-tRNA reductase